MIYLFLDQKYVFLSPIPYKILKSFSYSVSFTLGHIFLPRHFFVGPYRFRILVWATTKIVIK
jgi:hypothetical protein